MKMKIDKPITISTIAFIAWCSLTGLFLISTLIQFKVRGLDIFEALIQTGPISDRTLSLYSVAISWLLAGFFLYLLHSKKLHSGNVFAMAGFFLVSFLYLNVLRERPDYGDIQYYIRAANALHLDKHLPATYIYPPFWASLLEPLLQMGNKAIFNLAWLANVGSLFVFYFLLILMLEQYGFSGKLAALVTTIFMLVNVPILRTLFYVQVNLHVINLVFLSLLLLRRSPFLSALALAMAVHLKVSPILLVIAFILDKNWRWLLWFVFCTLLIGSFTVINHGFSPYLDFFINIKNLFASHEISFRENSIDSLFLAATNFLNLEHALARYAIYFTKLVIGVLGLTIVFKNIKGRTFYQREGPGTSLYNGVIGLLILSTLFSPLIWEHHGVFLALPFLVLLKRLSSGGEYAWFGFAYFFEFLLPTFDFFPWSYGRLFSALTCLGLCWYLSKKQDISPLFEAAESRLLNL
ncbi:MAG: DUF2029 domain-containing protein [Anaerolineales bacterium]|nr:DUF2029 domain-containing protein [Anaerolineales bacterium]